MSTTYDIGFHHETVDENGKQKTQFVGWRTGFTDEAQAQEFMRSMFGQPASNLRMTDKERADTHPDLAPDAPITFTA